MKTMLRPETARYIKNEIAAGRRVVAPRYGDGEYLMMSGQRDAGKELKSSMGPLLNKAIKRKGQLICTVPGLNKNSIWSKTAKYIRKQSEHDLYGTGAWTRWDMLHDNEILYKFFTKKVLLVSSLTEEAKKIFPDFSMYTMPARYASTKYKESLEDISKICCDFDNILFACGPIGKVIIADLIDKTDANMIDIGHILGVILRIKRHYASWARNLAKQGKLDAVVDSFLEKLGGN